MPFCMKCGASVQGAFCSQCGTPAPAASGQVPTPAGPIASTGPTPQPRGPSAAASARKTSPIVWVLVAILGLLLLGGLAAGGFAFFVVHKAREAGISPELWRRNAAAATARALALANPEIEIVSQDDGAGTVTVRDRTSGKTTTWNLDQARQGRITITAEGEDGKNATVEFGSGATHSLPSWVPSYPGSKDQSKFAITGNGSDGAGGTFAFTTADSPDKVLSFYQDRIKDLEMKVQMNTTTPEGGVITAADEDGRRSLNVVVGQASGQTSVSVTYGSKL